MSPEGLSGHSVPHRGHGRAKALRQEVIQAWASEEARCEVWRRQDEGLGVRGIGSWPWRILRGLSSNGGTYSVKCATH